MMDQVFPTLYRECVAITQQEQVIGYIHDLFVHVVRDDDSFGGFMGLDQPLHQLHMPVRGSRPHSRPVLWTAEETLEDNKENL